MRRVTHTLFYTNSPKSTAVERGQDPKLDVTTKTYIPNHPLVLFMDRKSPKSAWNVTVSEICSGPTLKPPDRILESERLQAR